MRRASYTRKPRRRYQVWKDHVSNTPRPERAARANDQVAASSGMKPFFGKSIQDYLPSANVRNLVVVLVSMAAASALFWVGLKAVVWIMDPARAL